MPAKSIRKRIKSLWGATPPHKLRWTNATCFVAGECYEDFSEAALGREGIVTVRPAKCSRSITASIAFRDGPRGRIEQDWVVRLRS